MSDVPELNLDPPRLLARVPLFRELTGEQLGRLGRRARVVELPEDRVVLGPDDPGHALYVLMAGEVQVVSPSRSEEVELSRLGPGESFGEMAVLNRAPRSAAVRTTAPTRALRLEREAFRAEVAEDPALALTLLEVLSLRIHDADEQIGDLSDQALRDPLTGLLNRRAFRERLVEECDRTRRYGEPFSLVLLDIDHFSGLNEDYGRAVGDQVLEWIGRVLGEHTRSADSAYRIGGEEFAVICPSAEGDVAASAARRLVDVVARASPPVDFQFTVTLSAGFASAPTDARRPDALYHLADRALLRAKAEGRNRVSPPQSPF